MTPAALRSSSGEPDIFQPVRPIGVGGWQPVVKRAPRRNRPRSSQGVTEPATGPVDYRDVLLDILAHAVGGAGELLTLDDLPLLDEEFDWTGVSPDIDTKVAEILELCDGCWDCASNVEFRTATRRLLARIAVGDPEVFRRRARTETTAATLCWSVAKANNLFTLYRGVRVKDLLAHFRIMQGGVSQRARTMLRAGGFTESYYGEIHLESPGYLVSTRRRQIIQLRDRLGHTE